MSTCTEFGGINCHSSSRDRNDLDRKRNLVSEISNQFYYETPIDKWRGVKLLYSSCLNRITAYMMELEQVLFCRFIFPSNERCRGCNMQLRVSTIEPATYSMSKNCNLKKINKILKNLNNPVYQWHRSTLFKNLNLVVKNFKWLFNMLKLSKIELISVHFLIF